MKDELKKKLKSSFNIILKFVLIENNEIIIYFAKRNFYSIIKSIKIKIFTKKENFKLDILKLFDIFEIEVAIFHKLIKDKIYNLFIVILNKINNDILIFI